MKIVFHFLTANLHTAFVTVPGGQLSSHCITKVQAALGGTLTYFTPALQAHLNSLVHNCQPAAERRSEFSIEDAI